MIGSDDYRRLRAALEAELAVPGVVTKTRLRDAIARTEPPPLPPAGRFADERFDPAVFD